jgi:iron(III) transport system permease protein
LNDAISARQIAGILLIFVFALLTLERYARRKTHYSQSGTSKRIKRLQLNRGQRIAAIILCTAVVLVGFVLPFLQLLYWVLFESVLHLDHDFWVLIVNSVKLATITAFFAVVIAVGLAYMQREIKLRFIESAVFTASLGYAIPGTVIAVGVMIPFAAADHAMDSFFRTHFNFSSGLLLSGTLFILVFAYLVRFLAVSIGNVQTGLLGIHAHLDDAAKSLGMNASKTVTKVHLPLLRSSLLSAALLVFVDTLKELPATLVLRPFNFNTLAVRSYELANDEQLANAAPAVITIVLAGLIPVILLNASMRQKSHSAKAQSV